MRSKLLTKGLYGCEIAPVNESAMSSMRSSFVDCLTNTTTRRSTDLTFATCSGKVDLDPDIEVVVRRVMAMRRASVREERYSDMVKGIMEEG